MVLSQFPPPILSLGSFLFCLPFYTTKTTLTDGLKEDGRAMAHHHLFRHHHNPLLRDPFSSLFFCALIFLSFYLSTANPRSVLYCLCYTAALCSKRVHSLLPPRQCIILLSPSVPLSCRSSLGALCCSELVNRLILLQRSESNGRRRRCLLGSTSSSYY